MQTLLLERSIPTCTGNKFSVTYLGNIIFKTTCLIHVSARELNSLQLGECVTLHAVVALRLWFQAAQHRATRNLPRCTGQLPAKKFGRFQNETTTWTACGSFVLDGHRAGHDETYRMFCDARWRSRDGAKGLAKFMHVEVARLAYTRAIAYCYRSIVT